MTVACFLSLMVNIMPKSETFHYAKGSVKGVFCNVSIGTSRKVHFCDTKF